MAYYRTEEGKIKKQLQNSKRSRSAPTSEQGERAEDVSREAHEGLGFDAGMVLYLVMVTSLIEGRVVSREEIVEMLARAMRQHSMARLRRVEYLVWHLNKHPP